jgi:hypothetical protein
MVGEVEEEAHVEQVTREEHETYEEAPEEQDGLFDNILFFICILKYFTILTR